MSFALAAKARTVTGRNVAALRQESTIPAVVYGVGVKNQSIQINLQEFQKTYRAAGENQVVDLSIDGEKMVHVLIRDVQIDPARRDVIHVDFYAIDITKPVEVEVPIEFTGIAPAVKLTGGSLVKKMAHIKVRCLPKDFAKFVAVPVVGLVTLEDVIAVKDIVVPSTWEVLEQAEDVVATVVPPRIETIDVKPAEAEAAVVAAVNAPAADKKEGETDAKADGKKPEGKKDGKK
ncbi:MAG: 50S ribosomal protein L25 [Parcubacteria group bacterium]|nr:50S ribosomal protein L25 [Parcubacteria group bacterium]